MFDPVFRDTVCNVISDLKTGMIRIGKQNDAALLCKAANKSKPLFILINTENVGLNNQSIKKIGKFDLIIFSLNNDRFADLNHNAPLWRSKAILQASPPESAWNRRKCSLSRYRQA